MRTTLITLLYVITGLLTRHVTSRKLEKCHTLTTQIHGSFLNTPKNILNMAPTVSRSTAQSKISDSFRSSGKVAKPLKQTKPPVKPIVKSPSAEAISEESDSKHLIPNNPKLVSAARAIEADRKAPFGERECKRRKLTK